MAEDSIATSFTSRELELLARAFFCLKSGDMAVDYTKFAKYGGFKNANSAKASWNGIRKKIEKFSAAFGEGADDDAESPAKRKQTDQDEPGDTGEALKKKAKKTPTKKAANKAQPGSDIKVNDEDKF